MQTITDNWIVGFVDGDGCFKNCFVVSQNKRSISVLYALKKRFNCGSVNKAGGDMREYRVRNKEDLKKHILPFFLRNSLQTNKWNDFKILYEKIYGIPLNREKGPIQINRDWLVGFTDAEGCFYTSVIKNYPRPQFVIGLHPIDREILESIQKFLGMGTVYARSSVKNPCVVYQISSIKNLVPLMKIFMTGTNRCLLRTMKRVSFLKFKQIIRIIEQKEHLTEKGIQKIQKIKKFSQTINMDNRKTEDSIR
jgi:hypothetical protein